MTTIKIKIPSEFTEQKLMEKCLNLASSGYEPTFYLLLYALKKKWHYEKLAYYILLLEEAKNE